MKKGIDVTAERDIFEDWAEQWLNMKKLEVSHNWFLSLCSKVDTLEPLYKMPISKIRTADIQAVINYLATNPNATRNKPYSKKSLKEIRIAATSIFQMAIENRVLDYNPVTAVKIPNTTETVKRRALSDEEQLWIINTPHRAQRAAMIMMFSGLRRGELIPLTWNDIDFNEKTISVNKSVEFIKGKPIVKETAKSKKSIRTIFVPQMLIDFLKDENRTSLIVCPSAKGTIMTDTAWKRMWESYLNDINLKYGEFGNYVSTSGETPKKFAPTKAPFVIPRFTAHWLRHTFITMLYFSGVDVLTAKEQAGHADIKTTMEIYTHLDSKFKKNSMQKLDDYLSLKDEKDIKDSV